MQTQVKTRRMNSQIAVRVSTHRSQSKPMATIAADIRREIPAIAKSMKLETAVSH